MSGGNTTTQNQTQQSQTSPWTPAQPLLQNILGTLGGQSTAPTTAQNTAVQNLQTEAAGVPNLGQPAANAANTALTTSTAPQAGMLNTAYTNLQHELTPYASGAMNNPMSNPDIKNLIDTTNQDITNQITGQFAAAGRPVGTNAASAQALARGLSQGEAGILTNQYNTNVQNQFGAANTLENAAGSTAGGLTQQQLAQIQAQGAGIGEAGALPGLFTQPGQTMLGAANTAYTLPFGNIQTLEGLTVPIAGLGAESTGQSTGTTTQQTPWWTTALGAGLMGASLLSDERLKENKVPVGMLFDGQPIWSYTYVDDPTPRIGLMAQEVERVHPEAVSDFGGIKSVHYGLATETSREIAAGMLNEMAMAA